MKDLERTLDVQKRELVTAETNLRLNTNEKRALTMSLKSSLTKSQN